MNVKAGLWVVNVPDSFIREKESKHLAYEPQCHPPKLWPKVWLVNYVFIFSSPKTQGSVSIMGGLAWAII